MTALKFTWNPVSGIDLGFITIHFYSLMFVVTFASCFYLMKPIFKREGIKKEKLDSLFIYTVIAIVLGMRLGHVIFYQTELIWEDPLAVLLPISTQNGFEFTGFRGLASHGAVVGVLVSMYYYNKKVLKKSWLWILDRLAVVSGIGAMFVRLGNFFNSEMIGHSTDSAIGIKFIQHEISKGKAVSLTKIQNPQKAYQALTDDPQFSSIIAELPYRYPGQLMEATGYLLVFFILMFLYWKTEARKKPGLLLGAFLLLLMGVRIIVERFKEVQVEGREEWFLNTGQLLSIPFILIGLYLVYNALTKKEAI